MRIRKEVPLAGECRSVRRDILLAALIALGVALAFLINSELECRLHQDLDRAYIPYETLTGG